MIRDILTLALLVFSIALGIATVPAKAAGLRCAPRDVAVQHLTTTYDERRRSVGLAANGTLVETYASDGGSWTILTTRPDGISCMIASGRWFEAVADDAPTGDPA